MLPQDGDPQMMTRNRLASLLLPALGSMAVLVQADTVVTTIPDWNGSTSLNSLGEPDTGYFGQTLTVPLDARLVSYEFRVDQLSTTSTQYRSQVYLWDTVNDRATGAPLYTSADQTFDFTGTGYAAVTFTLPGGGVDLTPGQVIVLLFDAIAPGDTTASATQFGLVSPGTYAGGAGYALNSAGGTFLPTVDSWGAAGGDLAFQATFSGAPEPSTWAAGAVGLGVIAWRWARRKS
jgi:hypothetical protein